MADIELKEWIALSQRLTNADRVRNEPSTKIWSEIVAGIGSIESEPAPDADDSLPGGHETADLGRTRTHKAPRAVRRGRQRKFFGLAIGVAALVLGFSFLTGGEDNANSIAHATNSGLPESYSGTATATLIDNGSAIRVEFSDPLPTAAPVELWLVNIDVSDFRSLGLIDDDTNTFAIPTDIDLSEFPIVDLSIEANDGDQTHSGRSILRGRFLAS